MQNFYIIVAAQPEGQDEERVSIEYQDLYDSGLTVSDFLTQYGCFQFEWILLDVWVRNYPVGAVLNPWW